MSECCSYSVDGGAEFCNETYPVARIEHSCCECYSVIQPGQKYERVVGLWDGYFLTFKTCTPCATIRKEYFPTGWMYEQLRDDIYECMDIDYLEETTDE